MATTLEDLLLMDEERSGANVQKRPSTPSASGLEQPQPQTGSLEDLLRMDEERGLPSSGAKPAPARPTSSSVSDPSIQPGFWSAAWEQINPVKAVTGLWDMGKGLQASREEFLQANPNANFLDKAWFEWQQAGKVGKGLVTAPIEAIKEVGTDIGKRHYSTAAGRIAGNVVPALLGYGVRKFIPATPKLSPRARTAQAAKTQADTAYAATRAQLPPTTQGALRATVREKGKAMLSEAYSEWESLRQAARQRAKARYNIYDRATSHKNNTAPPGLELRKAKESIDVDGNIIIDEPALLTKTEWHSPVKTDSFKAELESLIEHDKFSPYPAGHPVRKFLDIMGDQKGYDYAEFDVLKKALGKLNTFAKADGPMTPAQGLALKIVDKSKPLMKAELKKIAANAKTPKQTAAQAYRSVYNSMKKGDLEWAKYIEGFREKAPAIKAGRKEYGRAIAQQPGVTKGIQPKKSVPSVGKAISKIEPTEELAKRALDVKKSAAKYTADEDLVNYYTSNASNLENLLSVAGKSTTDDVLAHLVDYIHNTGQWKKWTSAKPEVVQRLTAGRPGLADEITKVFSQLEEAERTLGQQVTTGVLQEALDSLNKVTSGPLGIITPAKVHKYQHLLARALQSPTIAAKLNKVLGTHIARVPLKVKTARAAGGALEATPANVILGNTGSEFNKEK